MTMEKEEILLGVEMGRLEIEPVKLNNTSCENPFMNCLQRRNIFKSPAFSKEPKCICRTQRKVKHSAIHKKKHSKILKEPVLKILKDYSNNNVCMETKEHLESSSKNISDVVSCDPLNLCTLVQHCNQLSISSSPSDENTVSNVSIENKWQKNETLHTRETKEPKAQSSQAGTCSQQALNPPCDVTIDELASYFETLVHIPKKMSSMAEMMYI